MEKGKHQNEEYFKNLPSGYRFLPTDSELAVDYLRNKILGRNLPRNRITDLNIYDYNPHQLSQMYELVGEKAWYFFCPRTRKNTEGKRSDRTANNGHWKTVAAANSIRSNNRLDSWVLCKIYNAKGMAKNYKGVNEKTKDVVPASHQPPPLSTPPPAACLLSLPPVQATNPSLAPYAYARLLTGR